MLVCAAREFVLRQEREARRAGVSKQREGHVEACERKVLAKRMPAIVICVFFVCILSKCNQCTHAYV